jgi:hypothetical protein
MADRTALNIGPALCVFGTAKFHTQDAVSVAIAPSTFDISTDAHGFIEKRQDSHQVVVGMTPDGRFNAALAAALWPYASTAIGSSIFTAADVPLVINGRDGRIHTVIAAAITKMPDLILSSTKIMLGSMEFTGVRKKNSLWSVADSLYTIAQTGGDSVWAAYTEFTSTDIKTQDYTGVWGAQGGFTSIKTQDGWTISFDMSTADIQVDDSGTIDKRLTSVGVMARCSPVGPTSLQIQAAQLYQNTGAARGKSPGALPTTSLVITGADASTIITIPRAAMVSSGYRFGSTVLGDGEIGFVGQRVVTAGALSSMWTLAAAA